MALSSRHYRLALLLLCLTLLPPCWLPATVAQAAAAPSIHDAAPIRAAALAHAGNVTLLRGSLTLTTPATDVVLEIFADTRYEAWLNGVWLGRGPARFSRVRQEYDRLPVGNLPAGTHTLAVLVHTNPTLSRSETIQSGLQAAVVGSVAEQPRLLLGTSTAWRALISPAWNPDARQVHGWQLLGKQELLDLRLLPADWNQPAFNDAGWPLAFAMPPGTYPNLQPRSIPTLANVPRAPLAVVSSGMLSPDQQIVDLDGTGSITRTATIALSSSTSISLPITAINTPTLLLNDTPLPAAWQPLADPRRPDAYVLTTTLPAGSHRLTVAVPPSGIAIGLPTGVQLDASVQQGTDPGRLMQLGEPVPSDLAAPQVTLTNGQAQISVPPPTGDQQIPAPRFLVLDFGRSIHARIALTATGTAGTIIDAGWDERLVAGHPLPAPGSLHINVWSQVDSWVLDGTPRQLTTLDTRTGRYLLLVVRGAGSVQIDGLHALEETIVQQVAGSFTSNDARLNQIWQVGVDTQEDGLSASRLEYTSQCCEAPSGVASNMNKHASTAALKCLDALMV